MTAVQFASDVTFLPKCTKLSIRYIAIPFISKLQCGCFPPTRTSDFFIFVHFLKFVSGFLGFFINLLFFLATLRYPQTLISYFLPIIVPFTSSSSTIHSLFVQCTCWRTTSSTLCLIPFLTFTYLINPSFDLTSTLLLIVELKYYAGNPITNILYFYKF